jgi:HrpA-like RNA helicase
MQRARAIRRQLLKYFERFSIPLVSCEEDTVKVRKCLLAGYFAQVARKKPDGKYISVRDGTTLEVHPSSVFWRGKTPDWVMFHEGENWGWSNMESEASILAHHSHSGRDQEHLYAGNNGNRTGLASRTRTTLLEKVSLINEQDSINSINSRGATNRAP